MVEQYHPRSLEEALQIRETTGATPYAGGTDLMVHPREGAVYLFLDRIPELQAVTAENGKLTVGSACTFTRLIQEPLVPPLVKEAVSHIAAPAIRNIGTVGGNICNASPKADSAMALIACDACVQLTSRQKVRVIPLNDFYLGRGSTVLREDELLTKIIVPQRENTRWFYQKVGGRASLAISRISFAGVFQKDERGRIAVCSATFGAVSSRILRFPQLEKMLLGKTAEEVGAVLPRCREAYQQEIVPTPGRVSAAYRHTVCMNLLQAFWSENQLIEKSQE